jgi:hypothetical protein
MNRDGMEEYGVGGGGEGCCWLLLLLGGLRGGILIGVGLVGLVSK